MDSAKVKIRRTKKYGRGVFAIKPIYRGEIVASFDGEIFDDDFDEWMDDLLNHAIQFEKAKWRDSKGLARYINHSCEPNCGIKRLFDIVAMRTIESGEQITWDYEMTEKNPWWKMKCRCGSAYCRKVIGNYVRMPQAIRRKYKGFISRWLLRSKR